MASLKSLTTDTIWYGFSNIGAKLLNYILTPIVTNLLNNAAGMVEYGNYATLFAAISFINIVYTYGLETAYFRFSATGADRHTLFNTTFSSLIISTILFSTVLIGASGSLASTFGIANHPEYITWCVLIVALDTLSAIPYAMLRQQGRPRKYAFTKIGGILVNIILAILLTGVLPGWAAAHPNATLTHWYHQYTPAGFLILANLAQSAVTLLLLSKEWMVYKPQLDTRLWKEIITYCWPMLIVGLGGMVNETIDRLMLGQLLPGTEAERKTAVGIYNANYKISIFITLFIQAFKMAAEPFFFKEAQSKNAPATYARVMKWFVITLCIAFLFTALFIDIWQYFIASQYRSGLGVVPILLVANIALGIYYNLSVWYKITDRMYMGMIITLIGAAITLIANTIFIPIYGMYACAWTTLAAYGTMMVLSYLLGQRYYPVPYPTGKLLGYLAVMLLCYQAAHLLASYVQLPILRLGAGFLLFGTFLALLLRSERAELQGLPLVGKYLRR